MPIPTRLTRLGSRRTARLVAATTQSSSPGLPVRPKSASDALVVTLTAVMAVVTVLLVWDTPDNLTPVLDAPWWMVVVVVVGAAGAQYSVFRLYKRGNGMALSWSEVPVAMSLAFLSPVLGVFARAVPASATDSRLAKQPPRKAAFNFVLFALEMAFAFWVMRRLPQWSPSWSSFPPVALVAALLSATVVTASLVALAISASTGGFCRLVLSMFRSTWLMTLANVMTAVVFVELAAVSYWLALFAMVPVLVLWDGMRTYGDVQQRVSEMADVFGFSSRTAGALHTAELAPCAVADISSLLCAKGCHLVLFDGYPTTSSGTFSGSLPSGHDDPVWGELLAAGDTVFVGADVLEAAGAIGETGVVLAPVGDAQGLIGALLINGRIDPATPSQQDLGMLSELAVQLAVSLRRCMLHERIEAEAQMDALTGLLNRASFERLVQDMLESPDGVEDMFVMSLNLERFDELTATVGQDAGDALLVEFATRLRSRSAPEDLVARFPSGTFAVCGRRPPSELELFADGCWRSSSRPFVVTGLQVVLTAAVGVAVAASAMSAAELVRRSHVASRHSAVQRSGAELFRAEFDHERNLDRVAMLADLRAALAPDSDELEAVFQPTLHLASGAITDVSVTVRWSRPSGVVDPVALTALAESAGLVKQLTDFVLSQGVAGLADIRARGFDLGASVRLSAIDLLDSRLPDRTSGYLRVNAVEAEVLAVEVSESVLLDDPPRSSETIAALAGAGVGLSVSDFGAGLASLNYLRTVSAQELKIAASFVSVLLVDVQVAALLASAIDLGHSLGLPVVATGVDSSEQMAELSAMGCDAVQGACVAAPMPIAELLDWLSSDRYEVGTISPTGLLL